MPPSVGWPLSVGELQNSVAKFEFCLLVFVIFRKKNIKSKNMELKEAG